MNTFTYDITDCIEAKITVKERDDFLMNGTVTTVYDVEIAGQKFERCEVTAPTTSQAFVHDEPTFMEMMRSLELDAKDSGRLAECIEDAVTSA
ncbi:hypothetical protein [Marinobacter qingdaonensis]|uniref:Uncharacterized protein n=1 Tax=Marinobacter qingdaonensis TaxID=3108486 RepID=A0ABU5NUN4_9GAMM|nr:hypothetical protein [Marinobacter sp. ASW11-75]MEA1079510.1 hypothetical protein [Marinobacter sp. ASW11-75]